MSMSKSTLKMIIKPWTFHLYINATKKEYSNEFNN